MSRGTNTVNKHFVNTLAFPNHGPMLHLFEFLVILDGRKRRALKRTRAFRNARFKNTSVSKWFLNPF